jgi:hypothetical protein
MLHRAQMECPQGRETGRKSGAPGSGGSVAKLWRQTQQVKISESSKLMFMASNVNARLANRTPADE